MMMKLLAIIAFTSLLLAPTELTLAAEPKLAAVFSDHMVLQRDKPVPIWGWATPGERVTVHFAGQDKSTTANPTGKWLTRLDPMPASFQARTLQVNGLAITDVLVGEVWLASGQSNMVYTLSPEHDAAAIAAADHSELRFFTESSEGAIKPQDNCKGEWKVGSPTTIAACSAVAYYFVEELRRELKVPVGVIISSVGGTQGESWLSREAQAASPELRDFAGKQIDAMEHFEENSKLFQEALPRWETKYGAVDTGNANFEKGWAREHFDDSAWPTCKAPVWWRDFGWKGGGVVWLRKSLNVPADQAGKFASIGFGGYSEDVTVYFNNQELKPCWPRPPRFFNWWAYFNIPQGVVKPGRNVLALRVHSLTEKGLVWALPKDIVPFADKATTDDTWRYGVEKRFPDLTPEARASLPAAPEARIENTASGLFNGKIHPLIPYAIRGVIWYQGESNTSRGSHYAPLLTALINDWRARWNEDDFPFYIVQLANYYQIPKEPGNSGEAEVREGQLKVSQTVANTGLAVTIDIGEENIHPPDKLDVGHRLALLALAKTYGRSTLAWSGPIYRSMAIEGHSIRITFDHVEGGLLAKGGALQRFAIAGTDRKVIWADAKIDGESVVVSSTQVPAPLAVRYAWAANPQGCNLYNKSGLPASPFRTDDWATK